MEEINNKLNNLMDENVKKFDRIKRDYLGASQLGKYCDRALQYDFSKINNRAALPSKTLRTFEIGHNLEDLAIKWLEKSGFEIKTRNEDGKQLGFESYHRKIQGHVDGIILKSPLNDIKTPAIWECKTANNANWKKIAKEGVKIAKPEYATQIALYQAYMSEQFEDIYKNPALLTVINKDSSEIYFELVHFDSYLAQRASDRAIDIIKATEADEILPRISTTPTFFKCKMCSWHEHCWRNLDAS